MKIKNFFTGQIAFEMRTYARGTNTNGGSCKD